MAKKEMFILLDKSSPNIPDACVQIIPTLSSNDNDNNDNDSIPAASSVKKCCIDASVPAATTVTAQVRTCCTKWLCQPAESEEAGGTIQNIESLEE
eukprot:13624195-Ditylum_brightwellii.AAC.1